MIFRSRRRDRAGAGGGPTTADVDRLQSTQELLGEIGALTAEARARRDPELERRILGLRHRAGLELVDRSAARPDYATPGFDRLANGSNLVEVGPRELTPELLRAAILRHGCLLVRGLLDPAQVAGLVEGIDRAFDSREAQTSGQPADDAYYSEFVPDERFDLSTDRQWIGGASNFWAVDSPRVMFDLFETFERTGLRRVATDYLGEHPAISVNKCTLRRVFPSDFQGEIPSAWHQDGAFLSDVRALNVWVALTRCGDVAPGLDIVPRRLDDIVATGTDGATFDWSVSKPMAERVAGDVGILRPIFESGDVLLFDDLFLHATAATPEMPNTRYAVECWFFGPSAFPSDYAPLVS
jgi:hypothetical protein